jgi:phosphate starvation-inducible PhoH-like protein
MNQKRHKGLKTLTAKTQNQKLYIRAIVESDVIICTGPAGSGKSFVAAGISAEHFIRGKADQIVVTRPLVCSGRDIGALPGELGEKIQPYLKPMEENLKHFLGRDRHKRDFLEGKIKYEPLEVMRGATYNNTYMILDEAQNCTVDQIKMFITRMGENSKAIINGDISQTDLGHRSGLDFCVSRLENIKGVGIIRLDYEDIQRHGIIGQILTALES